jgi:two-component system, OmpR family, KDP operon response regulator KdpE
MKTEMEKKKHILVVDDEVYILQLLKDILESEGYSVVVAGSGEEALALIPETQPDLIILDIKMPGLDGYQTLERIRKTSNVPVLMLSGVPEQDGLRPSFDIGADDYIHKPFLTGILIARIRAKLRSANSA